MNSLTFSETVEIKIRKHQAFWNMEKVDVPVVGLFLGGWTFFKDNHGGDNIWDYDEVLPEYLKPGNFIEDYERLFESEADLGDDLIRAAQPFPSIPWMEAIVGCSVKCSRPNVWSEPITNDVAGLPEIKFNPQNPWVLKYIEFLEVFGRYFKNKHPVSASILRGPSDILAAMIGDSTAVYSYIDRPEKTKEILSQITNVWCEFIRYQWQYAIKYCNGYAIPQNEIWVSQLPLRMQEDASALVSPDIYEQFLLKCDEQIFSLTDCSLMHLHTTSLFLLDYFLKNRSIGVIQISRDDGYENIGELLPYLKAVQSAKKRLILRGVFTTDELILIRQHISPIGFCIHTVVSTKQQGLENLKILKEKSWKVES